MKRFIAVASTVSCMLLAGALVAQPAEGGRGQGPGGRGGMRGGGAARAAQILKDMNVKPEVLTKVEEIAKKSRDEMTKLREDSGMTSATRGSQMDPEKRKVMMEKMTEINKKSMDEINALLSPEEKTKLEEKLKEAPAFGGRRGAGQPGEPAKDEPKKEEPKQEKKTE
jgi:Spy/CpxP family protein refolding chaperone